MTRDVEQFYRAVLEHVGDAVVTTDAHARVTFANPAAERLYGMSEAEAVGRSLLELMATTRFPDDVGGVHGVVAVLAENGAWRGEIEHTTPDGRELVFDVSTSYLRDDAGEVKGSVTVSRDVTLRKELETALEHSATHDGLTDLLNRSALTQLVDEALLSGERVAVAFVDLNGFKAINDTWGHDAGDEVLVHVAARLRRTIRPTDRAARFGGDEFVVLLRDVDEDGVVRCLVDRFTAEVERPIRTRAGAEHRVGASIGIAVSAPGDSVDTLLRRADEAMYDAKRSSNVRTANRR